VISRHSEARVRFVLVAPSHPGNIGAAARALKTMGFARLAAVAPREPGFRTHAEAVALASQATDVLAAASDHGDLTGALAGVTMAYAMTGYAREFGPRVVSMRDAAGEVRSLLEMPTAEIAFVFGTERSGLTNEEIERCQACCAIPADTRYGSLNLAQAVQVAAYELRIALAADVKSAPRFADEPAAAIEEIEGLYGHLEAALTALGYLDPEEPRRLMSRVRRLLARARPSAKEVDILRGICAAIIERKSERAGRKLRRSDMR